MPASFRICHREYISAIRKVGNIQIACGVNVFCVKHFAAHVCKRRMYRGRFPVEDYMNKAGSRAGKNDQSRRFRRGRIFDAGDAGTEFNDPQIGPP